jgi:hypothetical protein
MKNPPTGYNVYASTTNNPTTAHKQNVAAVGLRSQFTIAALNTSAAAPPTVDTAYQNYGAVRPPWNLPGIDYPVGYSGALSDVRTASLPGCASYSGGILSVTAPCTLSQLDYTVAGNSSAVCVSVGGSGNAIFDNSKFGINNATCPFGTIRFAGGASPNITVRYSEIDDFLQFTGDGFINAVAGSNTTWLVTYSYIRGLSCRLHNPAGGAGASFISEFNFFEGFGNTPTGCHWEMSELNTAAHVSLLQESFNTVVGSYVNGAFAGAATAVDYLTSAAGSPVQSGALTTAIASYNLEIALPNPDLSNEVDVSHPLWVDVASGNTVSLAKVLNNYVDWSGSYGPILLNFGGSDPGSLTAYTCTGNKDLFDGSALTGNYGGSTPFNCL